MRIFMGSPFLRFAGSSYHEIAVGAQLQSNARFRTKPFDSVLPRPLNDLSFFLVRAGLAQLVEQLICNQQVAGSSPITSSNFSQDGFRKEEIAGKVDSPNEEGRNSHRTLAIKSDVLRGEVPKWPTGEDCKSSGSAFAGSNPALSTIFWALSQVFSQWRSE